MAKYICAHCGTQEKPKLQAKGSLLGEILLWIVMLLIAPYTLFISVGIAIIFSLWRAVSKNKICASCSKDELVDIKSPRGKKLFQEYQ